MQIAATMSENCLVNIKMYLDTVLNEEKGFAACVVQNVGLIDLRHVCDESCRGFDSWLGAKFLVQQITFPRHSRVYRVSSTF